MEIHETESSHDLRDKTDKTLENEREKTDEHLERKTQEVEEKTNEKVRTIRLLPIQLVKVNVRRWTWRRNNCLKSRAFYRHDWTRNF